MNCECSIWIFTDNDWQWRPKNSADLLIDKIPTRREFNAALEKTASSVAGVLNKFNDFVSNTANEIIESKIYFGNFKQLNDFLYFNLYYYEI